MGKDSLSVIDVCVCSRVQQIHTTMVVLSIVSLIPRVVPATMRPEQLQISGIAFAHSVGLACIRMNTISYHARQALHVDRGNGLLGR